MAAASSVGSLYLKNEIQAAAAALRSPLTKVKLINELNQREAELGVQDKVSWHAEYKDSAWIVLGGLPYELTEGDIICVFSQYGEIVNINLVRDQKTGKSKGFCFICYEDQRSTILAVDNFNGIKIKGRTIRVDHVANYRPPKDTDDIDDVTKTLREKGCGVKTPPPSSSESSSEDETSAKKVKDKKEKRKKKKEKKKLKREKAMVVQEQRLRERNSPHETKIKKEKEDSGYNKYVVTIPGTRTPSEESKGSRNERNERSLGKDSGREQQKDDWSRDERGDKNRYDHRMERDQMNAEWRNERWEDRGWKDDKRDEQDRKEDRRDDRGRRETKLDNRTTREDRPDEREWRENRHNDRSRREDKEEVRDSRAEKSRERHRENSKHHESHYELHSGRRDDKAFYSESYSSQSREKIESKERDRHNDNREQYGISERRRH